MKLLFDQNISYRVIKKIADLFPNAKHVRILGLLNAIDSEIWQYAKDYNYAIVTFDADFYDLATLKEHPQE